jgi:hypothetical protein
VSGSKRLPIRLGMDVHSAYQDQYLGSIVEVLYGPPSTQRSGTNGRPTGDASYALTSQPELIIEEKTTVSPTSTVTTHVDGESLGPSPTASAGNSGPRIQSAANGYATRARVPPREVVAFAVRASLLDFLHPFYVPIGAVRSLSMEHVVLDRQRENIPSSWQRHPVNG